AMETVLQELIPYYLDPHAVRVVTGGPDVVHEMLDAQPDYVFFTGSPKVGSIIASACAERLIEYTLELGGQSPAYVHHDADIRTTASRLAWGKFLNAGQTCVAPNHIYVHEDIAARLTDAIIDEIQGQYGADPATSADNPRMITAEHATSVAEQLNASGGAITHGGTVNTTERYIAPTVVTDVGDDDALMSSEIFGPILPIIPVTGTQDALDRISRLDD